MSDAGEKYPNLEALSRGCISGRVSEWPMLRPEAKRALLELQQVKLDTARRCAEIAREVAAECEELNGRDGALFTAEAIWSEFKLGEGTGRFSMTDDRMSWAKGLYAASEVETMLCEALSVSADKAHLMMGKHLKPTRYTPSPAGRLYSPKDVNEYIEGWREFFRSQMRWQKYWDKAWEERRSEPHQR